LREKSQTAVAKFWVLPVAGEGGKRAGKRRNAIKEVWVYKTQWWVADTRKAPRVPVLTQTT